MSPKPKKATAEELSALVDELKARLEAADANAKRAATEARRTTLENVLAMLERRILLARDTGKKYVLALAHGEVKAMLDAEPESIVFDYPVRKDGEPHCSLPIGDCDACDHYNGGEGVDAECVKCVRLTRRARRNEARR